MPERLVKAFASRLGRRAFLRRTSMSIVGAVAGLLGLPRDVEATVNCQCCTLCISCSTVPCTGCACVYCWTCYKASTNTYWRCCECFNVNTYCDRRCTGVFCSWYKKLNVSSPLVA